MGSIGLSVLLVACLAFARAADLADPRTGGANGGPVAILFLSDEPQMDETYAKELAAAGYVFTGVSYYEPMAYEFIRRFNVIVLDRVPNAAAQYETFGQRMLGYWSNLTHVRRCQEEGAGLLVYASLGDGGGAMAGGWNQEMKPWGIQLQQACVLDRSLGFEVWQAYGWNAYCWTENLAKHPVTDGLKRLYYVTANMRWDDCYTATPLVVDANWTPLVRAMPGARVGTLVDRDWVFAPDSPESPLLGAVRTVGKGRLAVFSLCPYYAHRMGYAKLEGRNYGEMSCGIIDGIVLRKGNGVVPSDTGTFIARLYGWLAAPSAAAGFGGYRTGDPVARETAVKVGDEQAFTPVVDFDKLVMPPSWRHRPTAVQVGDKAYYPELSDPLVTGELTFFKALVGVHTELSDGQGTVEQYAAAAKAAGYAVLVFAENFEMLSRGDWDTLVAQCRTYTTAEFVCLPGVDIMDPDNNHFLIVAPPSYPPASWLSADGRRLAKTQMINLLWYNHMVAVHRPGTSPLPPERHKHFQAWSVYTYRGTHVVDDSLNSYAWQVMNGSNPHPLAVHEVFAPAEVAVAAGTGFQQLLPSDTVTNAAGYFRAGIAHYFEAPARYLISEGPIVHTFVCNPKDAGPAAENRLHFRVAVGVRSDVPLASVTLYDGFRVLRRWLPKGPEFETTADFQHARQYGLYVLAVDSKGRRVLTNSVRTVAGRYHSRCADRQNWLGHIGACYTGTFLPARFDLSLPAKSTVEASSVFTDVPGTCMANKLNFPFTTNDVVITESTLDETYVTARFSDVGLDAMPSLASKRSAVYDARVRYLNFTAGKPGQPNPTLMEYDVTLKRDVEPRDPAGPFPGLGGLRGKTYAWFDQAGTFVTGDVPNAPLDVPVGGMAGGIVMLSDGIRVQNGAFGLAPAKGNPQLIPAATRYQARFLILESDTGWRTQAGDGFAKDTEAWLRALGLAKETPYRLNLSRGTLVSAAFPARAEGPGGSVAGQVATPAEIPFDLPLLVQGANGNWPAGVWREGVGITYGGVFEGQAWTRLDVAKPGPFVVGNLVTADHPDLVLEVVKWLPDAVRIEVHNPTANPIRATVATAPEITGLKALRQKVDVPAGTTVYLE